MKELFKIIRILILSASKQACMRQFYYVLNYGGNLNSKRLFEYFSGLCNMKYIFLNNVTVFFVEICIYVAGYVVRRIKANKCKAVELRVKALC